MESTPFAFSVHHFINSVGADAGFASIIGLAILILLYFAQARETASLRAHAYEAAERIHDLEARLERVESAPQAAPHAAQAAGAPPLVYPNAAPAPAGVAAVRVMTGAPAGVGAPALTAATKLIPTAPAAVAVDPPGEEISVAGPRPATVAAGANGSSGANATLAPRRAAQTTQPPLPRVQVRPGQTMPPGRRPGPPPRGVRGQQPGGRSRRIIGILLAALGVVAVVVVLLIVTSGSSKSPSTSTSVSKTTNTPTRTRVSKRSVVNPATVTVAVLNGTNTTGLAARVAQNLQTEGYKEGAIQTATDQTHSTTMVGYLPGFKADAQAVATSLKLAAAAVGPVDQPAQAVACPTAGSCAANVIVTVGSDLATTQ